MRPTAKILIPIQPPGLYSEITTKKDASTFLVSPSCQMADTLLLQKEMRHSVAIMHIFSVKILF